LFGTANKPFLSAIFQTFLMSSSIKSNANFEIQLNDVLHKIDLKNSKMASDFAPDLELFNSIAVEFSQTEFQNYCLTFLMSSSKKSESMALKNLCWYRVLATTQITVFTINIAMITSFRYRISFSYTISYALLPYLLYQLD
jgi:hypothetical protein